MVSKPPSKSIFRPLGGVDQGLLHENRKLIERIDRRGILRGSLSLGALTLLGGCDPSENRSLQSVLRTVSDWNDGAQALIFRPNHLAPTYSVDQVVIPPRFNAHYDVEDVKPVSASTWKLELSGLINDRRPWDAESIYKLPEQEMIIKHICVEGWDYIGQWSEIGRAHV